MGKDGVKGAERMKERRSTVIDCIDNNYGEIQNIDK